MRSKISGVFPMKTAICRCRNKMIRIIVFLLHRHIAVFLDDNDVAALSSPRNPCERAGWRSFRGKGPDHTEEQGSSLIVKPVLD
jgi:hypothetical protein